MTFIDALELLGVAIDTARMAPVIGIAAACDGRRAHEPARMSAVVNLAFDGVQGHRPAEGHDHGLLPVKKGGVMRALETGIPIQPEAPPPAAEVT